METGKTEIFENVHTLPDNSRAWLEVRVHRSIDGGIDSSHRPWLRKFLASGLPKKRRATWLQKLSKQGKNDKTKKLAEASFHSLPSAVLSNPCYLHGVPDPHLLKARAICMVPSFERTVLSVRMDRMNGSPNHELTFPAQQSNPYAICVVALIKLPRPMLSAWCHCS